MKIMHLALIGAIVALTGCAASGPKFSELQASTPALKADQGRVYFYRSSSMFGAAIQPAISFDGKEVGKSQPGGYFYVDTVAGSHEASASTEATNKLTFVMDKGETKYVRTSPQLGLLAGHIVPELVSAEEAKKALPDLSYTGQAK